MKTLFAFMVSFVSLAAHADINLDKLGGVYKSSGCVATQMNGKQGYIKELYVFQSSGAFAMERNWYKAPDCQGEVFDKDSQQGTLKIGAPLINPGFIPENTYQVEYKTQNGTDLGLLWVDSNYSSLRVARGMGTMQNTMLSYTTYARSN